MPDRPPDEDRPPDRIERRTVTRFLYTLDELLTMRTNGWACPRCGLALLDVIEGDDRLAMPAVPSSDPSCRHPSLGRGQITVETAPRG